jgi:transcriptional repressor NrdR
MNSPDYSDTSIQETRTIEGGNTVRRRRESRQCQFRFTTYEQKEWKSHCDRTRDGTIEPYGSETVRTDSESPVEGPVTAKKATESVGEATTGIKNRDEQRVAADGIGDSVVDTAGCNSLNRGALVSWTNTTLHRTPQFESSRTYSRSKRSEISMQVENQYLQADGRSILGQAGIDYEQTDRKRHGCIRAHRTNERRKRKPTSSGRFLRGMFQ